MTDEQFAANLANSPSLMDRTSAVVIRKLIAECDEALAYGAEARIRENAAEDARVSASFRAEKAEAERDEALRLYHAEAETAHAEMDRADRAEAEVERLRDLLREAATMVQRMRDGSYALPMPYAEVTELLARIDAALATEDKP